MNITFFFFQVSREIPFVSRFHLSTTHLNRDSCLFVAGRKVPVYYCFDMNFFSLNSKPVATQRLSYPDIGMFSFLEFLSF